MTAEGDAPAGGGDAPLYHPFYCEENVYHLASAHAADPSERAVLFITNPSRAVAFWAQRAGRRPDGLVLWDYHVVLASAGEGGWDVLDLDSLLPFPTPLETWLDETFQPLPPALARLAPRFRVVDAATYLAEFTSDRGHMRDEEGEWKEAPPPWPAIHRPEHLSFLRWTLISAGDDSLSSDELRVRLRADTPSRSLQ